MIRVARRVWIGPDATCAQRTATCAELHFTVTGIDSATLERLFKPFT